MTRAQDENNGAELAIITDRAQGGSSLKSGQAEIMVHRRTLLDDWRGVGEPINETMCGCSACACDGLVARGTHYITLQVRDMLCLPSETAIAVWLRTRKQQPAALTWCLTLVNVLLRPISSHHLCMRCLLWPSIAGVLSPVGHGCMPRSGSVVNLMLACTACTQYTLVFA